MNKIILTLLFVATLGLATSLKANECNGTYYYANSNSDYTSAVVAALMNCCAGSTLTLYNLDTNESFTITVPLDGPNSSCAPL